MKNRMILLLIALLLIGGLVGGAIWYRLRAHRAAAVNDEAVPSAEQNQPVPTNTFDPDAGEIDQTSFENNQQLSTDTSVDTLAKEVDQTIILPEDLSDVQ